MKTGAWPAVALAGLLAGGCITAETGEVHVKLDPAGSGTYVRVLRNLQSDETSEDAQATDFADLMKAWQGDEFLLDGLRDGRYVKRRDVTVENGVLISREEGLFLRLDALDFWFGAGGEIRTRFGGDSLISTNGTFNPDSDWVEWAPDAGELDVVTRFRDFDPHSDFVAMFGKRTGR